MVKESDRNSYLHAVTTILQHIALPRLENAESVLGSLGKHLLEVSQAIFGEIQNIKSTGVERLRGKTLKDLRDCLESITGTFKRREFISVPESADRSAYEPRKLCHPPN